MACDYRANGPPIHWTGSCRHCQHRHQAGMGRPRAALDLGCKCAFGPSSCLLFPACQCARVRCHSSHPILRTAVEPLFGRLQCGRSSPFHSPAMLGCTQGSCGANAGPDMSSLLSQSCPARWCPERSPGRCGADPPLCRCCIDVAAGIQRLHPAQPRTHRPGQPTAPPVFHP